MIRKRRMGRRGIMQILFLGFAVLAATCAGMTIRDEESRLGARLHPREIRFAMTASNAPVDPRVADAVNAAIEQTAVERRLMTSERLEPLAYAVAVYTGITPNSRSTCERNYVECCDLFCRVMASRARAVLVQARNDLDREFLANSVDPLADLTDPCAGRALADRLQCLRGLFTAGPSEAKIGPFLVSGLITSALAKAFDVQAQIGEIETTIAQQAKREADEQQKERARPCENAIARAAAVFVSSRIQLAEARDAWEDAKRMCGDFWSGAQQERMDNALREAERSLQRLSQQEQPEDPPSIEYGKKPPSSAVGVFAGSGHFVDANAGGGCRAVEDASLSMTIDDEGRLVWSGSSSLDIVCPGEGPHPTRCVHTGSGTLRQEGAHLVVRLKTTRARGVSLSGLGQHVWRCGDLRIVVPSTVELGGSCVQLGIAEPDRGEVAAVNTVCGYSKPWEDLSDAIVRVRGRSLDLPYLGGRRRLILKSVGSVTGSLTAPRTD